MHRLALRAHLSLQQIVGTVVFWGVLQPHGFISSLSAKAELALKFISRTVTEGEAGKQLTVKPVMALPLRSAHRDEPVLWGPLDNQIQ